MPPPFSSPSASIKNAILTAFTGESADGRTVNVVQALVMAAGAAEDVAEEVGNGLIRIAESIDGLAAAIREAKR